MASITTHAKSACSAYNPVAFSDPTGRYETTISVCVSLNPAATVDRLPFRLSNLIAQALSDSLLHYAAMNQNAQMRHVGEPAGIVRYSEHSFGHSFGRILADLGDIDVESRGKSDISDVISDKIRMHRAGNEIGLVGIAIDLDVLYQRRRAVSDPDDRYLSLSRYHLP